MPLHEESQYPTIQDYDIGDLKTDDAADDDCSQGVAPDRRSGRRKIKIEYIDDKSRRQITFSKRKAGIMKKAYELATLTGTQVFLLVVSETGLVYTFTTAKLQPLVTKGEGKGLIQACLNADDCETPIPSQKIPVIHCERYNTRNGEGGGLVAADVDDFDHPEGHNNSRFVTRRPEQQFSSQPQLYATHMQ